MRMFPAIRPQIYFAMPIIAQFDIDESLVNNTFTVETLHKGTLNALMRGTLTNYYILLIAVERDKLFTINTFPKGKGNPSVQKVVNLVEVKTYIAHRLNDIALRLDVFRDIFPRKGGTRKFKDKLFIEYMLVSKIKASQSKKNPANITPQTIYQSALSRLFSPEVKKQKEVYGLKFISNEYMTFSHIKWDKCQKEFNFTALPIQYFIKYQSEYSNMDHSHDTDITEHTEEEQKSQSSFTSSG